MLKRNKLQRRAKEKGLCPNYITLVSPLPACASATLVEIGLESFQSMLGVGRWGLATDVGKLKTFLVYRLVPEKNAGAQVGASVGFQTLRVPGDLNGSFSCSRGLFITIDPSYGIVNLVVGVALSIASSVLVPEADAVVAFSGVPSSRLPRLWREKLKASGIPYEVHIYPGNAHGFMNRSPEGVKRRKDMEMPDEDEASSELAWSGSKHG
ncbi:hypothetical protein POTOM_010965 [Populus tomentosa]|uniref:Dienelactone hydrolase domain-containing protein n=1 Tax=Populus tomentosa TaxID=118781 RepID=A0A8X8ADZ1_POPTO|nr:hypothetical protein POTOM_010965 [Populus tomentosa]